MKIEKLTQEQEAQIQLYRERYWQQATSTEPADRPRAEAAARRLAEIGGVDVKSVTWVLSPEQGAQEYGDTWDAIRAALGASLRNALRNALWNSGRGELG